MKLKCQAVIILGLLFSLAGQARAQHSGLYLGALGGGNILMSAEGSDPQGSFELNFKPGVQGSGVVGWDFVPGKADQGEGRVELEYTWRSNKLDEAKFAEGSVTGGGELTVQSLLVNFFGVFHGTSRWAPYLGAGLGAAKIKASDLQVAGQPLSSDSAYVFAYQAGAGIDYALAKNLNLDLGYRFFGTTRPHLTEVNNGLKFGMDYFSHSVVVGVRVGF